MVPRSQRVVGKHRHTENKQIMVWLARKLTSHLVCSLLGSVEVQMWFRKCWYQSSLGFEEEQLLPFFHPPKPIALVALEICHFGYCCIFPTSGGLNV